VILLSFAANSVSATTLIIGSNNDLTRYPFGLDPAAASSAFPDFAAGGTYQEVYAGSAFSGPVIITQIALASKGQLTSGPGIAIYNFNLALSTTAAGPGGLSTNLAANRGADFVQVFSGPLITNITANNQFDLVIDIVPFTYDPANGNLLLDVSFNSPTQFSGGTALYFNAGFSSNTSRAANPSGNPGGAFTDGFAAQTRFTTKSNAQVTLGTLAQTFDGSPKSVVVTTDPAGLEVTVTYDGSATAPTNAGSYAVVATVNDPNFIGQANGILIISKADQQIVFGPLPNRRLADPDFNVIAAASSNLAVIFAANGNCTVTGSQIHLTGAGTCTVTASQDGNANVNPAVPVAQTFSIGKTDQQITFDALADKKFDDVDFAVSATASSNLPVSFAANGTCTVNGNQVHLTGAGACTITASQDGNANTNPAAPVARTFSIGKASQQITFAALANKTFGDGDFSINATASSGLPVSLAAGGNCTLNGNQAHLSGAGECTITASQDGDTNFNAAAPVARTFSIGKADQQITFAALSDRKFGEGDFDLAATASSNLAVTFVASGACEVAHNEGHLIGAGQCTITASQAGDANFNAAAPSARTFSVAKADQVITFAALPDREFGVADFSVNATSTSNLIVEFVASGNCTVNNHTAHLTGAGQCTVTASREGDANFNPATPVERTFSIRKADQQIAFDALTDKKFGDADFAVSATASSNLTVSFAAGGSCTVNGNQVHLTGAGACTINASQDGDANINAAAPVARTFSVSKADQQITFDLLGDRKFGDADFSVIATASSNLAISLAATGNCALNGNQIHLTGAGQCTITASQDGNANINSATPVARTFSIGKANQQITFAALADKKFGDADFNVAGTASSNLAVSFAAGGNCTLAGIQVHLTGAGQCTITASQDGNADINAAAPIARTFSIGKADQQITFDALTDKKFGDADFAVNAAVSSSLAVSFAASGNCTVTGNQVHLTGAGPCTITASQDGNANINAAAPVARAFSIGKADQQITFAALADKKFGDADFNIAGTASSNLAVSFAAGGNCTLNGNRVHLTGAGQCTITASQDGDANIKAAAPVARTFTIGKADQQITFAALPNKAVGDADFNVQATASSNLAVSFAAAGNCTLSGNQVHLTGAGQCTITASQDGSADINAATPVARTFSIGKSDQQITFEPLAGKIFGAQDFSVTASASSNLAVSFSAVGNCTISGNQVHLTGAGSCTIKASQDGDGKTNAAASVARTFAIGKSDQQITFEALADKQVGDPDFNISATASSNLAVSFAASGDCTVTGSQVRLTGAGSCTITAAQDGDSDYNQAAAVSRTFAINEPAKTQTLISFGASAFEVAESVGSVRITVKRSGDTSGSSTVNYATDDTGASINCAQFNGIAASRCDFDAAIGTLKFAPGETEKSFDVVINRDSSVEVPSESFTVKLSSPTGGAALGATSSATVQIDDTSGGVPPDTNVIDDTRTFVRQQYHDFLNREADAAGLAFWVDNIDKCNDPARRPAELTVAQCKEVMRINTSAAFFLSIEFQQTGNLVRSFYVATLDRPLTNNMPAFTEFERDTQAMQLGVVVGRGNWEQTLIDNRDAFMKDFVTRPEFAGLYPTTDTPAQYVDKLYLHAGLDPTSSERSDAIAEFGSITTAEDPGARGRALLRVIQNNSFQQREMNRSFVQMQYLGYLQRNPNDSPDSSFAGFEFWLEKLNRFNGNFIDAEMVRAFLNSQEYRARFGP
jgi:hypothetical protein